MNRARALGMAGLALTASVALAAPSFAAPPRTPAAQSPSSDATWCTQQGGSVVAYSPWYNTNSTHPTPLAGPVTMCRFTGTDGTIIVLPVDTLAAGSPTMAALAYTFKPDASESAPGDGTNPATWYCERIGGTAQFGDSPGDAGGWAPSSVTNPQSFVGMCVFADRSMIDQWGLAYHTHDIVRGTDLATKWRATMPKATAGTLFAR